MGSLLHVRHMCILKQKTVIANAVQNIDFIGVLLARRQLSP